MITPGLYYDQLETEVKPMNRKTELIINIFSVVVVAVVMLSLLSIGIFYSLDLFDIYQPDEPFSFSIRMSNILDTLNELENIATQFNNSRAINFGYNASAEYILSKLDTSYFNIKVQNFPVTIVENVETPQLAMTFPTAITFVEGVDFQTINYSGSGTLSETPISYVGSGCTEDDYVDFIEGQIAVSVRSSDCRTSFKCSLAQQQNASAFIIFNNEAGLFSTSAGDPFNIPLLAVTDEVGSIMMNMILAGQQPLFNLVTKTQQVTIYTSNIIAETIYGDKSSVIVSGSHLDSVEAGPGINDNGSGSAANLEMANEFAILKIQPVNVVRFAWWGAEELGLKGSEYYVASLSPDEIANIALNLNFDMIGSPNYYRGIYNGTQADQSIRTQCETITSLFQQYFNARNLTWSLSDFSGRSDYAPFLNAGIPAGGLDTGMEVYKTIDDQIKFGGVANCPYDPCYHQACDTTQNINRQALGQMSRAAAQILFNLASTLDLRTYLLNPSSN